MFQCSKSDAVLMFLSPSCNRNYNNSNGNSTLASQYPAINKAGISEYISGTEPRCTLDRSNWKTFKQKMFLQTNTYLREQILDLLLHYVKYHVNYEIFLTS